MDEQRRGPGTHAGQITTASISYTNHTLLPRPLETWRSGLCSSGCCPPTARSLTKIKVAFLRNGFAIRYRPTGLLERMSLISRAVSASAAWPTWRCGQPPRNGVAELAQPLVRKPSCSPSSPASGPSASPRHQWRHAQERWIAVANPPLSACSMKRSAQTAAVIWRIAAPGNRFADDASFLERRHPCATRANSAWRTPIRQDWGCWWILLPVDVQVEADPRIQAQAPGRLQDRRSAYLRLRNGEDLPPRTFIFGGKAAPGCAMAKLNLSAESRHPAEIVNNGSAPMDGGSVVFLPNFSVQPWPEGVSSGRPFRADLNGPARRPPAPQHEDGLKRGGHDRYPRWRQCWKFRDSGGPPRISSCSATPPKRSRRQRAMA